MKWNDLSMKDRATLILLGVASGVYDIGTIRDTYNEFAEGGETDNHNENDNMSWLQKKAYNYMFGDLPVDTIRKRAYENMQPAYEPGNTLDAVRRIRNSIKKNNKEEASWLMASELRRRNYGDDLFAEYLQIPKKDRRQLNNKFYSKYIVEPSKYKPSKAKDNNEYKKLKIEYPIFGYSGAIKEFDQADYPIKYLIENVLSGARSSSRKLRHLPLNPGETAHAKIIPFLGEHIVGRGYDSQGDYVSYYDLWDLAPSSLGGKSDESFGIGKPFELYDRIYLDDYYGVPEQYRGGYYLPEVTVTQNEYKNGGKIHIKPENRGKFTALMKRTGHSASWFKKNGTPALRKTATFALNARKWKHEDGGELVNEVDTIPESDLHYTLRKIGRAALAGPIFSLFLPPLLRDTTFVLKNVLKESENKTKSVDDNLLMQQDIIRRIKEVENSKTNPNGGYDAATGRWYPHDSVEGGAPTIAYGFKMDNGSKWTKLAKKLGYLTDELVEEALVDEAKRYSDNARIAYDAVYGDGAFNKLHYKSRSFLTDYEYNPGLKKFPKLMEGFYNGNIDTIRKEYKRYSNKRELGRNKSMALDIDSLAFGPYSIYKQFNIN